MEAYQSRSVWQGLVWVGVVKWEKGKERDEQHVEGEIGKRLDVDEQIRPRKGKFCCVSFQSPTLMGINILKPQPICLHGSTQIWANNIPGASSGCCAYYGLHQGKKTNVP